MHKVLFLLFILIILGGVGYFIYSRITMPPISTNNTTKETAAKEAILRQESPIRELQGDLVGYAGKVISKKEDSFVVGTANNQVNVAVVTNNTKARIIPLYASDAHIKIEERGFYKSSMINEGDFVDIFGTYNTANNTIAAIIISIYSTK